MKARLLLLLVVMSMMVFSLQGLASATVGFSDGYDGAVYGDGTTGFSDGYD